MLTRRRILRDSFAAALTVGCTPHADPRGTAVSRTCFFPKLMSGDVLAEESAHGFQSLLSGRSFVPGEFAQGRVGPGTVIILPGVRRLSADSARELRKGVEEGAWVIWERAANFSGQECDSRELLAQFFGVCISQPIRPVSTYIRYCWPIKCSVRGFHDAVCVRCSSGEAIAECEGRPVAMKRRVGKGGIVFLGAMLGPGIRAEEREARAMGQSLLQRCGVNRFD